MHGIQPLPPFAHLSDPTKLKMHLLLKVIPNLLEEKNFKTTCAQQIPRALPNFKETSETTLKQCYKSIYRNIEKDYKYRIMLNEFPPRCSPKEIMSEIEKVMHLYQHFLKKSMPVKFTPDQIKNISKSRIAKQSSAEMLLCMPVKNAYLQAINEKEIEEGFLPDILNLRNKTVKFSPNHTIYTVKNTHYRTPQTPRTI